eukprot:SAG31_NODE_2567_length_5464_cov_2.804660_4_plen_184_part_00
MQDICHNSRNTTPPTCRYAHAEDSLQQQVIALKRINPAARVFVYRNCALGLSTYGNSCAKMYGEATANWWLRVGDVKTAAVLNDPIDPTAGVRADRTGKGLLSRFCATIREIRGFNRETYGTNRESVCINSIQLRKESVAAWPASARPVLMGLPATTGPTILGRRFDAACRRWGRQSRWHLAG